MAIVDKLIAAIWEWIGLFNILKNMIPPVFLKVSKQWWSALERRYFNNYYYVDIREAQGFKLAENVMYNNVQYYLSSINTIPRALKTTLLRRKDANNLEFAPASDGTVQDFFQGARVFWSHRVETLGKNKVSKERGCFTLKLNKASKTLLLAYFDHIAARAAEFKSLNRTITLYANEGKDLKCKWKGVPFEHPSTFDSLALDPVIKDKIIKDLDLFRESKEAYKRIGRVWKRGYLLYGPPGTGKSSMVAAIANYMKYDVYDLELTKVSGNSDLRSFLLKTTNKSLIVIEDIDCSIFLENRSSSDCEIANERKGAKSGISLSGMLNFADGLWSSCGEERIMIFTTNYKDRIDPALLRSGRMDMHILLSYCTFPAFKVLASNYLHIDDHLLFPKVEEIMKESGAEMTPAEIAEILISYVDDPAQAFNEVISALNKKIKDNQHCSSNATSV